MSAQSANSAICAQSYPKKLDTKFAEFALFAVFAL